MKKLTEAIVIGVLGLASYRLVSHLTSRVAASEALPADLAEPSPTSHPQPAVATARENADKLREVAAALAAAPTAPRLSGPAVKSRLQELMESDNPEVSHAASRTRAVLKTFMARASESCWRGRSDIGHTKVEFVATVSKRKDDFKVSDVEVYPSGDPLPESVFECIRDRADAATRIVNAKEATRHFEDDFSSRDTVELELSSEAALGHKPT